MPIPTVTTTEATAASTKRKSSKAGKKSAKKPAKQPAKKPTKKPASGFERASDVPWNEKKVAVFKALKQLGATKGPTSARSAVQVADKAGVSQRDVRHYCYHARAAGLVEVAEAEGVRGYSFYLTARGAKVNPVKELAQQKAGKEK